MKRKILRKTRIVTILSALVVFLTVYSLVLPAITLTDDAADENPGINTSETTNVAEVEKLSLNEETSSDVEIETTEQAEEDVQKEEVKEEKKVIENVNYPAVSFSDSLGDMIVYVEAPEGAFPENTLMQLKEVEDEAALVDSINSNLENKEVKAIKAVDITFIYNNEEFEPLKPIKVSMTSSFIESNKEDEQLLVHVDNDNNANIVETTEVKEKDVEVINNVEEVQTLVENTDEINEITTDNTVAFESDAFSVYAVVYTVDFEYEGRILHFPGEGSYRLTDVLSEIGVEGPIDEASLTLVYGANKEGALYLEQIDNEYWISSDIPFTDVYELKVKSGTSIYTINVTDVSYDMKDAVSAVTADGLSGSTWTVKEGEEYTINISFAETPGVVQFPTTSNTLVYQLPNNFSPNSSLIDVPVVLTYTQASVVHTLNGCKFSVDPNGKVIITLTDEAKEKLAESGDGTINIHITGSFTETNEHTDFGGGNIKNIIVDDSKDVTINKSGEYKSDDNKVHYTVTVKADGSLTDVNVKDIISGTALTMDQGSLTYNGNSSVPTGGATSNGFNLTFPSMKNGEMITINYTASVNWDVIGEGKGTVEQTGNSVSVKPKETDEKTKENNLENKISYNPLSKASGSVQDTQDPDIKTIPWTITINAQGLKNMKNTTITDNNLSSSVMNYSGAGITIERFRVNADGSSTSLGSETKTWDNLGIDPETDSSWSYKITDDGNYKYVISYTTEVDVTGQNGYTYVQNYVNDNNNNGSTGSSNVGPGSSRIGVDKTFGTASAEEMTWTVVMDVPASGLNKAILIDTLPYNGTYRDSLNVDSLNVSGLENGDSYVLSQSKGKFTLTFYKDADYTIPGLNGTGRERHITVTFKTENDPLWIANNREDGHTNNVSFQGDNTTVYDQDTGKIPQIGVDKNSNGYRTVTINNEQKLVFEYTIDVFGVTDADFENGGLVLVDDYDERYLEFLDLSEESSIDGIDVYWAQQIRHSYGGERGDGKITPTESDGKLTFTIQKSNVPMNGEEFYKAYQLKYYLVAKDSTKLLNASLEKDNHIISIGNKVKWDNSDDEVTVDYSYPGIKKENIAPSNASDPNSKYDPEKGTTGFKIVINPDKLELNNGEPMKLEDVFTDNLSVVYSSIKITIEQADDVQGTPSVSYDYKGNTGTYFIPDKCKVTITYDARVIGAPYEWVSYGNTATMHGYSDSASGRAQMSGGGDGGFNIYSIDLFKYDAGHMEKGLNDAVFTLVDENGYPIVYPDTASDQSKRGKPITFKTEDKDGKPGYASISLNEQEDGISLQKGITYYVKETTSPSSHAMNNTTYRFTISDNPNYSNYEYHSGDILKVYDWPIMGRIEINKEIDGPSNLTEEDKKKITFEIAGTYDDGKPIKIDDWGYAIEKADLVKYSEEELARFEDFKINVTYADFTDGKYSMADLVDGIYTVKETAAALDGYNDVTTVRTVYQVDTEGNKIDSNHDGNLEDDSISGSENVVVSIIDQSKYVVNYKNTYSNKTGNFDLNIKKVDGSTNKALFGVVFRLEKLNIETGKYETVTEGSVDSEGKFSIGYDNKDVGVTLNSLNDGTYRITEVTAPTNYKVFGNGVIVFKIENSSGTILEGNEFVTYIGKTNSGEMVVKNDTKHSYKVTKVDGANVSLKLFGAEFGVWESSYPGTRDVSEAMKKDANNSTAPLWTYKTKEDGTFEIQMDDHEYESGKIYFFKEIKAPAGYELPKNPSINYFFFDFEGTAPTAMKPANLGSSSRSQTITNDLPDLEVKKLWKNLKGDNLNKQDVNVDEIEFVVYQRSVVKNADDEIISTGEWSRFPDAQTAYTIEYVNGNWSTVAIPNAPSLGNDSNGNIIYYEYKVEETDIDGWDAKVEWSNNDRIATITNTPEPIDIVVKKAWNTPSSMDPNKDNAIAYFEVYQKNDSGEWVQIPINGKNENELNKGNSWQMTFQVEAGKEYKIKETRSAPNHWPLTSFDTTIEYNNESFSGKELEFADGGTIKITNTYNEPYLEIRKVWQTENDISNLYPHVKIWRREIDTSSWEVWKQDETLNPSENWSKIYKGSDLPSNSHYEYYVEEVSIVEGGSWRTLNPNPYTVTYSASKEDPLQNYGTLSITNTKYDGEISVEKEWKYADGSTEPKDNSTAKVILQRALANKVGIPVQLVVTTYNYDHTYGSENPNPPTITTKTSDLTVSEGTNVIFALGSGSNIKSVKYSVNDVEQYSGESLPYNNITIPSIRAKTIINVDVVCQYDGYNSSNAHFVGKYDTDIEKIGDYEDVPGTAVILDAEKGWSYTWKNLPLDAGNNQEYVYSVRELQVNGKSISTSGFSCEVTGDEIQTGKVTVTNTELAKGSLKITKRVTINKVEKPGSKLADGDYTFKVTDSSGTKHYVIISITNGQSKTEILNDLPEGDCSIQEVSSSNKDVSIDSSVYTVTIVGGTTAESPNVASKTVTNNYEEQTTEFEFTKQWKNTDGNTESWQSDITVTLYSQKGEVKEFTLSDSGGTDDTYPWTVVHNLDGTYTFKFTGLPKEDNGEECIYYVKETRVENYNDPVAGTKVDGEIKPKTSEDTQENVKAYNNEYIINTPVESISLPSTGGPGYSLIKAAGVTIMILAIVTFLERKKRK